MFTYLNAQKKYYYTDEAVDFNHAKRRGLGMMKKLIAAGITLLILGLYFFVGTGTI